MHVTIPEDLPWDMQAGDSDTDILTPRKPRLMRVFVS